MSAIELVVIGASWGGLDALSKVFREMPADYSVPILVVQHRSRHADNLLVALLQDVTELRVVDVEDKEPLEPRRVYVAPGNYHMLVENGHLSLTTDPPVRFSRPSIDITFISAADAYRSGTVGVVLTGANDDGARGLKYIVNHGGSAIVQDPRTAESPSMPQAAITAVPQAEVLPLERIARRLVTLAESASRRSRQRTT